MQTVLEQGSIDKPLTFDVGLIQLSFIPVCSLNTCNISVKLCRGFALQCFSLSLLVETGQLPGAGLTQADKTCIQLNFYLEILKGGHLGFKGGQKPPLPPPKCNPALYVQMAHPAPPINTNIECFLYYLAV